MLPAAFDHVPSAERVRFIEQLPRPPNAGDGRGVEDHIDPLAGPLDFRGMANVAAGDLNTQAGQGRGLSTNQGADLVATLPELFDDVLAEETAGAGNKSFQGRTMEQEDGVWARRVASDTLADEQKL